jgi:processive 1,2-diacylglycerol beta-glucosyltransferase
MDEGGGRVSEQAIRILVLTSSTGGGHDTRARALRDWAAREHPGWTVEMHQALEETHWIYGVGVEAYNIIQRTWPALHHIYYNILEAVSFCGGKPKEGDNGGFMAGRKVFMEVVRKAQPDLVVSTHDHLNHEFFSAARAALPESPPKCATYCGELEGGYGFSRHWVNPRADLFIGAVEECCAAARGLGMPAERTWRGDFLLDPSFWAPRDAEVEAGFVREELKLEPGRFTLLLSTGGNSAQNHLALLDALVAGGALPGPAQVVALCGNDKRAVEEVTAWGARHPELPVRALPRVKSLAQLMRVASVVVTRPGTGTTSEAILSGAPLLFNTLGGIMPQEMITVKYCRERGFGRVLRGPGDLAAAVRGWLAEPGTLAAERARVAAARPTRTPADILRRLEELVGK